MCEQVFSRFNGVSVSYIHSRSNSIQFHVHVQFFCSMIDKLAQKFNGTNATISSQNMQLVLHSTSFSPILSENEKSFTMVKINQIHSGIIMLVLEFDEPTISCINHALVPIVSPLPFRSLQLQILNDNGSFELIQTIPEKYVRC